MDKFLFEGIAFLRLAVLVCILVLILIECFEQASYDLIGIRKHIFRKPLFLLLLVDLQHQRIKLLPIVIFTFQMGSHQLKPPFH